MLTEPPDAERLRSAPGELLTGVLLDSLSFRVFDEVPQVLARLRACGFALVVASNWDASLERVLERVGLLAQLDGVVTSAAAGFAKPDPRLLDRAVSLAAAVLGGPPRQVVHVGDSLIEDVGAAHAAGLRAVLVRRRGERHAVEDEVRERADALQRVPVIGSLAELPGLLGCEVSSAP